jgi:hypothetical protein
MVPPPNLLLQIHRERHPPDERHCCPYRAPINVRRYSDKPDRTRDHAGGHRGRFIQPPTPEHGPGLSGYAEDTDCQAAEGG